MARQLHQNDGRHFSWQMMVIIGDQRLHDDKDIVLSILAHSNRGSVGTFDGIPGDFDRFLGK